MRKAAIVTGSTKGIGKAIALNLIKNGYFVYVNYFHDEEAANSLKNYLETQGFDKSYSIIKADISKKDGIIKFIEKIDFKNYNLCSLILNASSNGSVRNEFRKITEEEMLKIFWSNLFAPFFLVQSLADKIEEEGSIVFISSHVGIYPHSTYIPYGLTKAAEISLAKMLVKEFAERRITVNTVAPAFIETSMFPGNRTPEHLESIRQKVAVHRFGKAEEVAAAVTALIENKYINGSVLSVDGGYDYK